MKILVVDDEPLITRTLALIFEKHGFEASSALTADDALASALSNPPDLVLCDIDMPGRDGLSLMSDLSRELPGCPILVLTGRYSSIARVRELADTLRQRVNIITKPCQPSDLLRSANDMLKIA
jgi:DNA-binding response OmpR family regulator